MDIKGSLFLTTLPFTMDGCEPDIINIVGVITWYMSAYDTQFMTKEMEPFDYVLPSPSITKTYRLAARTMMKIRLATSVKTRPLLKSMYSSSSGKTTAFSTGTSSPFSGNGGLSTFCIYEINLFSTGHDKARDSHNVTY